MEQEPDDKQLTKCLGPGCEKTVKPDQFYCDVHTKEAVDENMKRGKRRVGSRG